MTGLSSWKAAACSACWRPAMLLDEGASMLSVVARSSRPEEPALLLLLPLLLGWTVAADHVQ